MIMTQNHIQFMQVTHAKEAAPLTCDFGMKLGRRWFLIPILCFSPLHTHTLLCLSQFVLLSKSQINNSRNAPSLLKFGFYRCLYNEFKNWNEKGLNYVFKFLFNVNYGFSALWLLLPPTLCPKTRFDPWPSTHEAKALQLCQFTFSDTLQSM